MSVACSWGGQRFQSLSRSISFSLSFSFTLNVNRSQSSCLLSLTQSHAHSRSLTLTHAHLFSLPHPVPHFRSQSPSLKMPVVWYACGVNAACLRRARGMAVLSLWYVGAWLNSAICMVNKTIRTLSKAYHGVTRPWQGLPKIRNGLHTLSKAN